MAATPTAAMMHSRITSATEVPNKGRIASIMFEDRLLDSSSVMRGFIQCDIYFGGGASLVTSKRR
jgi:hypothetical protein